MNSSDENKDRELLERYRAASSAESLAPTDAVRAAILEEGRRAAASFSSEPVRRRPSRWKMTAFATAATVLLAALVIAPKLLQHERQGVAAGSLINSFKQAAVRKAQPEPPAYVSESPVPVVPVQPAPPAKLENIAPLPRAESLRPNVPPPPPIHYPEQSVEISPLNQSRNLPENRAAAAAQPPATAFAQKSQMPGALLGATAARDAVKATQLLDQRAVSIDERDGSGRTPLMLAVEQGQLDTVRSLLGRGADPNAADQTGLTPLKLAQQKGLSEIAAALTQAGAR